MAEEKDRGSAAAEPAKTNKDKPQTKKEKKQKSHKVRGFFKDLKAETKKITWYSKMDTLKSSGIVIAAIVIFTVVIGLIDWGFGSLIALLGNIV